MDEVRKICDILQELRKDNALRQKDIADLLNVSISTVSHYEAGLNIPDLYTIIKLADYYGVSIDYLLGRTMIKFDFEVFRKQVRLSDGSMTSLEKIAMVFMQLSEQSQSDLVKLMKLYKLGDDMRRRKLKSAANIKKEFHNSEDDNI